MRILSLCQVSKHCRSPGRSQFFLAGIAHIELHGPIGLSRQAANQIIVGTNQALVVGAGNGIHQPGDPLYRILLNLNTVTGFGLNRYIFLSLNGS